MPYQKWYQARLIKKYRMRTEVQVVVIDRNGNIIPDEKLDETVIDCELYYMYINSIRERLTEVDDEDDSTEEKAK